MRILYVLFFLLTLNSCQKVKEKEVVRLMKEWNRKEVLFPDDLLFTVLEKDTLKEIPKSDYTIITYVDSIGCTSCKLKLQNWLLLERKLRSITNKRVSCLFVIHPKSKKEVNYILQENHFDCPVCIDDSDIFNKLNKFPANIMYQTFLLDAGNKVVAISLFLWYCSVAERRRRYAERRQLHGRPVVRPLVLREPGQMEQQHRRRIPQLDLPPHSPRNREYLAVGAVRRHRHQLL